ncbi:TITAN-like protein [Impatiens glandulifera]|uniref:TITAN-like protein n=1 Tax=Impatiens glandulifera TaxID=253017 RepID=UPI001FB18C03|nr:TITAN-like protein [Impatiens glandulifera]
MKSPVLHGSENRVWCVFCNCDIEELSSFFAFGTAIHHLASASHLKNTKSFLWKHGGKMDKVDSLRILEADIVKWEKKCRLLKSDGANETTHGPLNDIHNDFNSKCSDFSSVRDNQTLYMRSQFETVPCNANYLTGTSNTYVRKDSISIGGGVHLDGEAVNREIVNQGLNSLTKISIPLQQDGQGNVHSGAPPPWFDHLNAGLKSESRSSGSLSKQGGKSKLNPNRVGAAWAEQRKIEMEMEKRGEIVSRDVDPNWLPNFGSVWQSGTRKKSRKEFESEEKKKSANNKVDDSESEASIRIQPYVSKRMKKDRGE